jgi:hypothetical protein
MAEVIDVQTLRDGARDQCVEGPVRHGGAPVYSRDAVAATVDVANPDEASGRTRHC